jgi:SNF2 family DNA or RNA helicase
MEYDSDKPGPTNEVNFNNKKISNLLLEIDWHRVVLDEAHFIKNEASQRKKCCQVTPSPGMY